MQTRLCGSLKYPGGVVAVLLLLASAPHAATQQQQTKSQQIYLPDPTPRQTDPNILYGDHPETQARIQQLEAQRNAKRRELVEWAANELVLLSKQLQVDVAKHPAGVSMAPDAANAEKIEQLAKNLKAAVKAP